MDERFPSWLRTVVRKLDFMGLPNLGMLICGLAVLGFIGRNMLGAPLDQFLFDPYLVREGQWWRLFAFPMSAGSNAIWLLFFVMYSYFVMSALEGTWGPGPLTVYVLLSYICAIAASFLAGRPLDIWFHVMENVGLAFGTLFPDVELLLIVFPVKAKWIAIFTGALILLQFVRDGFHFFWIVVMFPYLLFFSPMLISHIRTRRRVARNRRKFDQDSWR